MRATAPLAFVLSLVLVRVGTSVSLSAGYRATHEETQVIPTVTSNAQWRFTYRLIDEFSKWKRELEAAIGASKKRTQRGSLVLQVVDTVKRQGGIPVRGHLARTCVPGLFYFLRVCNSSPRHQSLRTGTGESARPRTRHA